MGANISSIPKLNFEDIVSILKIHKFDKSRYIIINTMPTDMQSHLILGTLKIDEEVSILNNMIKSNIGINIVIYGINCSDNSVIKKYEQLRKLGFYNVHVYLGGLFEWILLQDIYGDESFQLSSNEKIDILKYRGKSHLANL